MMSKNTCRQLGRDAGSRRTAAHSKSSAAALSASVAMLAMAAAANSQQPAPPRQPGQVTAYVVMTPTGPATEGYISGLAAGSRHDVLSAFRLEDLGAWLDRYCAANPQTKLPLAVNALGREMLAHRGGKL
jgi:hypothetical protein